MAAQERDAKRLHCGRAAQAGVTRALLAARGFTGIPNVLEAPYGGFTGAPTAASRNSPTSPTASASAGKF